MTPLDEFRTRIKSWLEENCPASMQTPLVNDDEEVWGGRNEQIKLADSKLWFERMAHAGLTAPTLAKEYGGAGLSGAEAAIFDEEHRRLGCRPALKSIGIWMLAPVILRYGTEAQKLAFLPPMCRGEVRWCQGYSEPGAGSDLASLQMRAELEDDHYVVNGQKVWTSQADKSDWIFCLVRTSTGGSKREGISFLLVDMATPGVTVKPIPLISGYSPFCETHFENVRVPIINRIGEENRGWQIGKEVLEYERSLISQMRDMNADEDASLGNLAKRAVGTKNGVIADPILRDRIAQANIDFLCNKLTLRRSAQTVAAGRSPGAETSMFKYYATELNKRRRELKVAIEGFQGLGWEGPGFTAGELQHTREWLRSRANSIEGGSSEIQLNIIAKRVLALPD